MKAVERFNALSGEKQNLIILSAIGVFGTLVCLPLCLLPQVGIGGAIGFFAGSLLELFSYWTICKASAILLGHATSKPSATFFVIACYFLRLILIAGALVLASFCTFRWKVPYLYVWTLFAALLPVYPVLIYNTLRQTSKKKAEEKK